MESGKRSGRNVNSIGFQAFWGVSNSEARVIPHYSPRVLNDKEWGSDKELTPEQRMLVAMIEDAVRLAIGNNQWEPHLKIDAYFWLMSKEYKRAYTFEWCCMHLKINADAVRTVVKKKFNKEHFYH